MRFGTVSLEEARGGVLAHTLHSGGRPIVRKGAVLGDDEIERLREAGIEAVDAALQAHGGSGFTEDTGLYEMYPLVRLLRTAPVNRELCLSFIGEKVMGLPRSY